jgi:hypothetical protein
MLEATARLTDVTGELWGYAYLLAFISMIAESSKPKLAEGEKERAGLGASLIMLASLVTPFVLYVHAFWAMANAQAGELLVPLLVSLLVLVLVPSLLGMLVRSVAPNGARWIYLVAPFLSVGALAFALYVTHANVGAALDYHVLSTLR